MLHHRHLFRLFVTSHPNKPRNNARAEEEPRRLIFTATTNLESHRRYTYPTLLVRKRDHHQQHTVTSLDVFPRLPRLSTPSCISSNSSHLLVSHSPIPWWPDGSRSFRFATPRRSRHQSDLNNRSNARLFFPSYFFLCFFIYETITSQLSRLRRPRWLRRRADRLLPPRQALAAPSRHPRPRCSAAVAAPTVQPCDEIQTLSNPSKKTPTPPPSSVRYDHLSFLFSIVASYRVPWRVLWRARSPLLACRLPPPPHAFHPLSP